MSAKATGFCRLVEDFFQNFLVAERDLSPNTVLSYRDAMKLLLSFVSGETRKAPERLTLQDFDSERIRAFLAWLADDRGCSNRTLNQPRRRSAGSRTSSAARSSSSPPLPQASTIFSRSQKRISRAARAWTSALTSIRSR